MAANSDLYMFTPEQMREHNNNIARAAADAGAKHAARKLKDMNPAQQLQSMSRDYKSLKLSDEVLNKITDAVTAEEVRK